MSVIPRFLLRAIRFVLPESARDGLVGDLEELYPERHAETGGVMAACWLASQLVVVLVRYGPRRVNGPLEKPGHHGQPDDRHRAVPQKHASTYHLNPLVADRTVRIERSPSSLLEAR